MSGQSRDAFLMTDEPLDTTLSEPIRFGRIVDVPGKGRQPARGRISGPAAARPARGWTNRRIARILAFQVLYEADLAHHQPGGVWAGSPSWTANSPVPG